VHRVHTAPGDGHLRSGRAARDPAEAAGSQAAAGVGAAIWQGLGSKAIGMFDGPSPKPL
jgi:hypothetical protein